jgi:hypothetical protein
MFRGKGSSWTMPYSSLSSLKSSAARSSLMLASAGAPQLVVTMVSVSGSVSRSRGHDLAAAGFERLQHLHFVFKTLFLPRTAEGFMDAAVVADLDDGTDAVFGDFHEGGVETGGDRNLEVHRSAFNLTFLTSVHPR